MPQAHSSSTRGQRVAARGSGAGVAGGVKRDVHHQLIGQAFQGALQGVGVQRGRHGQAGLHLEHLLAGHGAAQDAGAELVDAHPMLRQLAGDRLDDAGTVMAEQFQGEAAGGTRGGLGGGAGHGDLQVGCRQGSQCGDQCLASGGRDGWFATGQAADLTLSAVGFNETFSLSDTIFYLSGVVVAGIVGYLFLLKMRSKERFNLGDFHGLSYEHKWLSFGFLVACLALAGFPITTTFLGEDLLFTHIHEDQIVLAALVSLNFVIVGIALMRMYSRIFLGPHKKSHHPVPLRGA